MTEYPSITEQGWPVTLFSETSRHYNSGMTGHKGEKLLCTRAVNPATGLGQLVWRRFENGIPKTFQIIDLPFPKRRESYEDPRLFWHNRHLYLSYTEAFYLPVGWIAHQKLALVNHDLTLAKIWKIPYGDNGDPKHKQKNWSFFSYNKKLYFIYKIMGEHTIIRVEDGLPVEEIKTPSLDTWKWGTMSGGTPPIRLQDPTYGDVYLTFAHGYIPHIGRHRRYCMWTYMFKAEHPFPIVAITPPLLWGSEEDPDLENPEDKRWDPVVVFPNGAIYENGTWEVSAGVNDSYDCLAKFDHSKLPFKPIEDWRPPWKSYFHTPNASLPVRVAFGKFIQWNKVKGFGLGVSNNEGILATSSSDIFSCALNGRGVTEIDEATYRSLTSAPITTALS